MEQKQKDTRTGITIDLSRDENLSSQSTMLLRDYYCRDDENSPQYAFSRAAKAYSGDDNELAQRIYDYVSKGWFMYSSPVLSNAVIPGEKVNALPISCYLGYVSDSLKGLIDHSSEIRWLSVKGGGIGGHWSNVRSVSDKSPGPMPFMHTIDADMVAFRQGKTRKGSYAAYLDVSHPDIMEFLSMRVPTGDVNRKNFNIHHAVNITDEFMEAVKNGSMWQLKDPNDSEVRDEMPARKLWETILETRYRTGEPYLNFIDTANRVMPQEQKNLGLKIHGSNLCNEIFLPTSEDRTAVCCLSSVNLEKYDDWKDTPMIADCVRFLDNVLQVFIDNSPDEISRARYSATQERSLGLGAMGFHSYLQSKGIPFASDEAFEVNRSIFSDIQTKAVNESFVLGKERGECPDMSGSGRRNAHVLAVAPNANSSMIVNTSPSIEPWKANAFTSRSRVGSHLNKNRYLEDALKSYDKNTDDVWSSIITNNGSVQHLDFLSEKEKQVFLTAIEIDQVELVRMAGERQKNICQGQSLNVFFPASADKKYVHKVHYTAWQVGCKGLYYLRTESSNKAENVSSKVVREKLEETNISFVNGVEDDQDACPSCQG